MGKLIISTSSSGGIDPDELTTLPGDVLKGKIFGGSGSDEPQIGTLELTGDITATDIRKGKTGYSKDAKTKITGTQEDRGTWTGRIGVNGKIAIPAGIHSGGGYVDQAINNRGSLSKTLAINETYWLPEGYYSGGYVNQEIPVQGGQTIYPTNSQQVVSCSGKYMTGNITVSAVSNLLAQYIKKGVQVGNVMGTFEGYVTSIGDLYYNGVNPSDMVACAGEDYFGFDATAMWVAKGGSVNSWMFFRTNNKSTLNAGNRIYVQSNNNIRKDITNSTYAYFHPTMTGYLQDISTTDRVSVAFLNDNTFYFTVPKTYPSVHIYLEISKNSSGTIRIPRVWIE